MRDWSIQLVSLGTMALLLASNLSLLLCLQRVSGRTFLEFRNHLLPSIRQLSEAYRDGTMSDRRARGYYLVYKASQRFGIVSLVVLLVLMIFTY